MYGILCLLAACSIAAAQQECGRKPEQPPFPLNGKIVGGRNALPNYWPWQLSLQFLRENTTDTYGHTCGASLIDPWWALTAAHCVEERMVGLNDSRREDPDNFRLLLGAHTLADLRGVQIRFIDLIVKHDRWVPNPYIGYPNDIALLRLTEPADLNWQGVELACLPKEQNFTFTGEECWITGWGKLNWRDDFIPAILQEARADAISNEDCLAKNPGYIRDSHICPGTGYPNACSGDSGGPMTCLRDGTWFQAGLTSWGVATCSLVPPVYTRISYYWDWINIMMQLNSPSI
jgi:secreted trypsin-like serine protease